MATDHTHETEPASEPDEAKVVQADEPEEPQPAKKSPGTSKLARFKSWYGGHKKVSIPTSVLVLLLILATVPFTRYSLAGLALKHDVSVKVTDSVANTPVSGVTASIGSISAQTN